MRQAPVVAVALLPLLAGCTAPAGAAVPDVVVTFYPLAFLAEGIAGPHLRVATLVPPGTEPHDWEPSPRDIESVRGARVFVHNGAGLEPWAERLAAELPPGVRVVEATHGLELHAGEDHADHDAPGEDHAAAEGEEVDPHAWLDPFLYQQMATNVLQGMRSADPGNASAYEVRAADVHARLAALHDMFAAGLRECRSRDILTTHAAFGYLADRYGITQHSISGLSPEAEPSPARIRDAVELARRLNATHIFFETLVSPRVAQTIAREVGAQTLVLNPIEGLTAEDRAANRDYVALQEQNLANLRLALGCA
jgi:zinc transport system substrate-binding protein